MTWVSFSFRKVERKEKDIVLVKLKLKTKSESKEHIWKVCTCSRCDFVKCVLLVFRRKMLCRRSLSEKKTGSVPVYLNVYDLTPINGYAYWLGLGVYHSGVQVHGVEYAFGAHEYPTTGIFEGEPKQCEGFTFRKTILIGRTDLGPSQVRAVMEELAEEYKGNAYNLITKNCNHFCNDACLKLTGNSIPSWVNRLARIGFFCNCVLPATLNSTKVRHHKMEEKTIQEGEKAKLRSNSKRYTTSNSSSSSSSSPSTTRGRSRSRSRSKGRRTQPPTSPLIMSSPP